MDPSLDAFTTLHALGQQVQGIHLVTQAFLGDPNREPLHLLAHLNNIRNLRSDLGRHVFGHAPDAVYAHHLQQTIHLEDALLQLDRGYVENIGVRVDFPPGKPVPIKEEDLRERVGDGWYDKEIADVVGCSKKTITRRRHKLGLGLRAELRGTPDETIREHILRWWRFADHERTGAKMTLGWLRGQGIPCTRDQVRRVLRHMRPEEHIARTVQAADRRVYHAPFPNSIWHIDGNHKLINWKFVIHGGIDGHSHLVTFMTVSDNNRASSVRRTFLAGAQTWGWPSRVRADYGGENLLVKEEMEGLRGEDRGSFITGKSIHNQRIERLWRDVRNGFIKRYSQIFEALEADGFLDRQNPVHLYCLHHIFLPLIQQSIDEWVLAWNNHGMGTKGLLGRNPIKMFRLGKALAEKSVFFLDFFPHGRQLDEERGWYDEMDGFLPIDITQYSVMNNGVAQQREPSFKDPHVVVDRFADDLPEELYVPEFLEVLSGHFPVVDGRTPQDAQRAYVNCLSFVEGCLREWFPAPVVAQE